MSDLAATVSAIVGEDCSPRTDSDTMADTHLACPECGASIRARMAAVPQTIEVTTLTKMDRDPEGGFYGNADTIAVLGVTPVPNQVRPSDVLIVGARITPDVIDLVRTVEGALVAAVQEGGNRTAAHPEEGPQQSALAAEARAVAAEAALASVAATVTDMEFSTREWQREFDAGRLSSNGPGRDIGTFAKRLRAALAAPHRTEGVHPAQT